jgi:hypothetical protein
MHKKDSVQKAEEKEVIDKFLLEAGYRIQPQGIQVLNPPAPDILCKLAGGNNIAFELTETVDPNRVRKVNLSKYIPREMRTYFENMASLKQKRLQKIFGNANLFFNFDDAISKSSFKKLLPSIFQFLLSCSFDMNGIIKRKLLPHGVKDVRITRCDEFNGPMFSTSGALYWADKTIERIRKKFQKQYKCDCPIELLVHSKTHGLPPNTLWLLGVQKLVTQGISQSAFQRVWVFDYPTSKIRYVYPEDSQHIM